MKRNLNLFLIFVLLSCHYEIKNRHGQLKENKVVNDNSLTQNVNDSNSVELKLYTTLDSTPIYNSHDKSAKILTYAHYLDSFKRFNFYYGFNGISNKDFTAFFFPIEFNNDTAWISRSDGPALKICKEYFCNLEMVHFYHIGENGGIEYSSTRISNIITKHTLIRDINLQYSRKINENLYVFNSWENFGEIFIYNCIRDSFQYSRQGFYISQSKKSPLIYFLQIYSGISTKIPIELVEYNYDEHYEHILYTEPNDSTYPCIYYEDDADCTSLRLTEDDSSEIINFELYKLRDNPIDESDVIKYSIEVNENSGQFKRFAK
jgi:hypothetical protein